MSFITCLFNFSPKMQFAMENHSKFLFQANDAPLHGERELPIRDGAVSGQQVRHHAQDQLLQPNARRQVGLGSIVADLKLIQGDHSGCANPPVDIKTKILV